MTNKKELGGQIMKGYELGKKTHGFNDFHDPNEPAQWWFQNSEEGLVLFVVFFTQACRWSRCTGCNLPSKCSMLHIDYKHIINQIDWIFSHPEIKAKREEIKEMIISNNGSILDQDTFSTTALMYLMAQINLNLPNLAVLTQESRPEYIEPAELEILSRALKEGETPTRMRHAVGFEAFDEWIRNEKFQKGLKLDVFEEFVKRVAAYNMSIKTYFMQKPVSGMSDEEAVEDIKNAIDYLSQVSEKYGAKINMHLNPTYAAFGTVLEEEFYAGTYSPPKLTDVIRAVKHGKGKGISIYIGLFDEGLAVPGGSFIREGDEALIAKLDEFNRTQNYSIL